MMHDLARKGSFAVRLCESGCLHVDIGGVTLHMSLEEFLTLASVVRSAHYALCGDLEPSFEVSVADDGPLVM